MPNNAKNPIIHQGSLDGSAVADIMSCMQQQAILNVTPVSLTNPTAATTLLSCTIKANTLAATKGIEVFCAGTYNLAASSTFVITVLLGSVTVATFTSASQTNTSVTLNWNIELWGGVVTAGSAGTLELHGMMTFDSGATLPAAASTFLDSVVAVSSAIDFTQDQVFAVQANFGTGNASSVCAGRLLSVAITN